MAEITRIEKTFTYDIADQYLYQTNTLKRTAQWTYIGPRYLWIFVDSQTKKIIGGFHYLESDNGENVPTPVGQIKVKIDADVNPDIASLVHNELNYGALPHTVENLPDGSTYGHPDPIPPDHTYELTEITYDPVTQTFVKPYPWKKPHMTWEELKIWRNNMLKATDQRSRTCQPEKVPAWEEYRQKLRDIPAVFAGIDPWKVPFPKEPDQPEFVPDPAE